MTKLFRVHFKRLSNSLHIRRKDRRKSCRNLFHITHLYAYSLSLRIVVSNDVSWKQEGIPVGCVPPALVATTRCQHQGCTFQGVCTSRGCTFFMGVLQVYPPPRWDLGPGIPTPQKGPGTRHAHPPLDRMTDTSKNITFPQLHWRSIKTFCTISQSRQARVIYCPSPWDSGASLTETPHRPESN